MTSYGHHTMRFTERPAPDNRHYPHDQHVAIVLNCAREVHISSVLLSSRYPGGRAEPADWYAPVYLDGYLDSAYVVTSNASWSGHEASIAWLLGSNDAIIYTEALHL